MIALTATIAIALLCLGAWFRAKALAPDDDYDPMEHVPDDDRWAP